MLRSFSSQEEHLIVRENLISRNYAAVGSTTGVVYFLIPFPPLTCEAFAYDVVRDRRGAVEGPGWTCGMIAAHEAGVGA
ncbi:hypothetical protein, partial [Streptomyces cinereoruber]|uniref:hypothetical protein n=1 Tax=Streptomyces cinereoruber TaxID=67260 RepID=UPI0036434140